MTSSSEIRRKRLLFRSWHRGTLESDLILGRFADQHLAGFNDAQLDRYEALLDCADADIFDWVSGRAEPPPEHDHDVTQLLLACSAAGPHSPSPDGLGPPLSRDAGEGLASYLKCPSPAPRERVLSAAKRVRGPR